MSNVSMEYFLAESDSLRSIISDKDARILRLERALERITKAVEEYSDLHHAPKLEETIDKIEAILKGEG